MARTRPVRSRCSYLIELQLVQLFIEFSILLNFFQLYVVLLQTMEREFRLVVNEDFQGLLRGSEYGSATEAELVLRTFAMNFLQVTRISFASVALNIITCL